MALDEAYDTQPAGATRRAPRWQLLISTGLAAGALLVPALGHPGWSLVAYVVVLVLATGLLAWHRFAAGEASKDRNFVSRAWVRRLAVVAAVLIVLACATNAFVWATEASKL